MSYNYTKLSQVPLVVGSSEDINILVEEEGWIERIPASQIVTQQVQSDWDVDDENDPAFILNKPTITPGGGGVIYYRTGSGAVYNEDGDRLSISDILDDYNSGAILRFDEPLGFLNEQSDVLSIRLMEGSGSMILDLNFIANNEIQTFTIYD